MAKCKQESFGFASFDGGKIEACFGGGAVSSDGGVMVVREVDRRVGLTKGLDAVLPEERDRALITHSQLDLLRQRIYGIALGYEDLNDHDGLRNDPLWQTAVERGEELASSPTLCRLENRADRATAWAMHRVLGEQFIASHKTSPAELILDFDATDDRAHGNQEGRAFDGYYGEWCFLPLYVFCGEQLLVSYLRPSNLDAAKHSWAILSLLVKRLRQEWPQVKIIVRGDSGFCRWKMMRWCERRNVHYILGIAQNSRLNKLGHKRQKRAGRRYAITRTKQRLFDSYRYKAGSWESKRRVIHKAEQTGEGSNPRYIVTNLEGDSQHLYEEVYCARGEMENRIKEQQLGLFADRTSAHRWWSNQFRLLLSSCAYVLMETLRRTGFQATELARAQVQTIRLKLLKIGAVIIRNSRRIRLLLSSRYPHQQLFTQLGERLNSG